MPYQRTHPRLEREFYSQLSNLLLQTINMSSGCSCGNDCKCGSGCKCGSMYPDLENTTTETMIVGLAPVKTGYYEGSEYGAENDCKCGSNCSCDSCSCGK